MKTITLRIGDKVTATHTHYPVEIEIDGAVTKDEISCADVDLQTALLQDPGTWGGRELGGQDPNGPAPRPNEDFAQWLHKLVFARKLKTVWDNQILNSLKMGFRLVVDIDPTELRRLRWEQLGSDPVYPAILPQCSIVRGRLQSDELAFRDGPIKILAVVGSEPKDTAVLAEEEVAELEKAFADRANEVELKILDQPTREEIVDCYTKWTPHVFHFIGHGKLDSDKKPYLYLHDKSNAKDIPWPLSKISIDLGTHPPALAFLNACHSVDVAGRVESTEAVWSISDTFIRIVRARAVIGMHSAVKGDAAGKLAVAFYESILRGTDIDLALTQARDRIDRFKSHDPLRGWDWALPYLHLTVPPTQVLGMARVVPYLEQLDGGNVFKETSVLVNRLNERRQFLNRLQSETPRNSSLLLVKGERDVGKSDMVRCCLQTAARRGRLIKYVELNHNFQEDDQGIIRLMCDGYPNSLIGKPLPEEAMGEFYQTYNALIDGKDPRDKAIRDGYSKAPPWRGRNDFQKLPRKGGIQEQVDILYDALFDALIAAPTAARKRLARELEDQNDLRAAEPLTDTRPFLVILDQVAPDSVIAELFKCPFVEKLLKRTAEKKYRDLLVVVVVAETDHELLGLDNLGTVPDVPVPALPVDEFCELAMQYFDKFSKLPRYQRRPIARQKWADLVEAYKTAWLATELTWSFSILKNLRP